jgi:hypothetical protein
MKTDKQKLEIAIKALKDIAGCNKKELIEYIKTVDIIAIDALFLIQE